MADKKLRVLVCGDRHWRDKDAIMAALAELSDVEVVIEGEARGADTLAREVAEEFGIPVLPFPAEWGIYGRAAGPIRNTEMLNKGKPNLVLAFHNNIIKSKGTRNMVEQAKIRGIETRLHRGIKG